MVTHYIIHAVVNLTTNRCVRIIGKEESVRFLHLALHQGQIGKTATHSVVRRRRVTSGSRPVWLCHALQEMEVSNNPSLRRDTSDPSLFCAAYRKNRFYIFSRREPEDSKKLRNCCSGHPYSGCCSVGLTVREMFSTRSPRKRSRWQLHRLILLLSPTCTCASPSVRIQ